MAGGQRGRPRRAVTVSEPPTRPVPAPLPPWERELRRMAVLQRRELTALRRRRRSPLL